MAEHKIFRCGNWVKGGKCGAILLIADIEGKIEEQQGTLSVKCKKCGARNEVKMQTIYK